MYNSHNFTKIDNETFNLHIDTDKDYKILQLTDLHLGFGILSGKKDKLALSAVTKIIKKSRPDLIVLTGDSIFPFFPKSGTMNNGRQARILTAFMDRFKIPYTLCFGNHDCELGAFCNKDELADIFAEGKYCIFTKGNRYIYGVGNSLLILLMIIIKLCFRLLCLTLICMVMEAGSTADLIVYTRIRLNGV